jgi:hypothetical protein
MRTRKLGIAQYTEIEIQAALRALEAFWTKRRSEGSTDRAGRWYPSRSELQECCSSIREPSRSWPLPLLKHCQTLAHIEAREGVSHEVVLEVKKELKAQGFDPAATSMSSQDIEDSLERLGPALLASCEQRLLAHEVAKAPSRAAPRSL